MKIKFMFVDTDSIFFKIAYKSKNQSELRKNYNSFCNKMKMEVSDKMVNPFTDELQVLYAVKGTGNFRKDLSPDYKSQRPELDKEVRDKLNYLHKYAVSKGAIQADGMEADDLVSIWAHEALDRKEEYVICGIDKDLLQIPGHHYNYGKDTWKLINEEEALHNLYLQCLTGDATDNIPGLKGIGPKKAEKILAGVPLNRQWNKIKATWKEHRQTIEQLELSHKLLRMLTTWIEYEDIKAYIQDQTSVSKSDDIQEQSNKADQVHTISK
jgi:DNA polymerase-1